MSGGRVGLVSRVSLVADYTDVQSAQIRICVIPHLTHQAYQTDPTYETHPTHQTYPPYQTYLTFLTL
jgi:hypothetical protein